MTGTIFVINPNSSRFVTERIDAAIAPLRLSCGPAIECLELQRGPAGMRSQADADGAIAHLLEAASELENRAAAFVIAGFTDPGLHALRERSSRPVFGITECGVVDALTRGETFGVLATERRSFKRHQRYFRMMGVQSRLAGERALELDMAGLADSGVLLARSISMATLLRDECGADVILLGGAALSICRHQIEEEIGIPVVDPNQAGVSMALGRVLLAAGE